MNKKTDTMSRISLLLSIALLALASTGTADKFYKWGDENGVTHYGSQAPNDRDASVVNTRANASSDRGEALDALEARRNANQKARKAATQQAEEEQRLETEPDAVAQERCEQHRKNLETLQNKPIVRQENPDTGELEVLGQEEKDKMIEDARQALELCK